MNRREYATLVLKFKFKTSVLRSSLFNYSGAYILVKGTLTVPNTTAAGGSSDNRSKNVIFKNCTSFTDCISEINNTEIDHSSDIDIVMPMYNLVKYNDNYLETSGTLLQYYRDKQDLTDNDIIINFGDDSGSALFKFKSKMTNQIGNDGTKDLQIMVPLKYLSNFWRTLSIN